MNIEYRISNIEYRVVRSASPMKLKGAASNKKPVVLEARMRKHPVYLHGSGSGSQTGYAGRFRIKEMVLLIVLFFCAFCCYLPAQAVEPPAPSTQATPVSAAPAAASSQADTPPQAPEGANPNEEAAYPQTVRPGYAVGKKLGPIPKKKGDLTGEAYIGQRLVTEKHAGWGWIKGERMNWRSAKWVMIQETPGTIHIPSRYTGDTRTDNGMQYRMYGEFAPYLGYEPNIDVYVPVFILKGFELIGQGDPVNRSLPTSSIMNRAGRISERGANAPKRALRP